VRSSKEQLHLTNGTMAKNEPGVPTSSFFDTTLSYIHIQLFLILPVPAAFVLAVCRADYDCLEKVRMKLEA